MRNDYSYLGNDGDLGSEIVQAELGDVLSINEDGARGWLNDTEQSQREGRLAGARTPHDPDLREKCKMGTLEWK